MRTFGLYAVVLVAAGRGFYEDARGTRRAVGVGDALLIFPELPHRYGPGSEAAWDETYVVFDGPVFDQWRAAKWISEAHPVWTVSPVRRWAQRLRACWRPGEDPAGGVGRLLAWLGDARAVQPLADAGHADREAWLTEARLRLERDLEQPLDLPGLAAELGLTYAGFRRRFTRAVGMPPARYRAQRAIDQAALLMQTTALHDYQIAAALGFCDEYHFSRRFKQLMGMSPRAYRRAAEADRRD